MYKINMKKLISIIILIGWIVLVLYLSYQNGQDTANTSMTFTKDVLNFLMRGEPDWETLLLWDGRFRLAAHFGLFFCYGMISMAVLSAWTDTTLMITGLSLCSGAALAVLSETGKLFIAGRHCDFGEMGLNVIGIFAGVVLAALCRQIFHRRKRETV